MQVLRSAGEDPEEGDKLAGGVGRQHRAGAGGGDPDGGGGLFCILTPRTGYVSNSSTILNIVNCKLSTLKWIFRLILLKNIAQLILYIPS